MSLVNVSDIQHGYSTKSLIARVYRVWDAVIPTKKDSILSLELALIDEKGDCIHGTANKFIRDKFVYDLIEGEVYRFTGFMAYTVKKTYKSVPRDMFITLAKQTTIEHIPIPPKQMPNRGFFPIEFEEVPLRATMKEHLTDVIGFVTSVGLMDPVNSGDNVGFKRDIEIENERSERITIALWDRQGYDFDIEKWVQTSKNEHIIIALAGLIVRQYKDNKPTENGNIKGGPSTMINEEKGKRVIEEENINSTGKKSKKDETHVDTDSVIDIDKSVVGPLTYNGKSALVYGGGVGVYNKFRNPTNPTDPTGVVGWFSGCKLKTRVNPTRP
ncbi:hypothetical protein LUZ60_016609 [Juncus effusus]|nr:hypothetical protein LUZ60_016609 [Juncus effusus]